MKIDMSVKLKTLNGSGVLKNVVGGEENEITLGLVCCEALLRQASPTAKEAPEDWKAKLRKYQLAVRIDQDMSANGTSTSLTSEDVVMLKDLIGKTFPVLVCGQAILLLDDAN